MLLHLILKFFLRQTFMEVPGHKDQVKVEDPAQDSGLLAKSNS